MDGQELLRLSVECYKSLRSKYPFIKLPPKGNGRPGFHESAILLLRQGMVAGTTLTAIPCLVLSALPCIISGKTLENSSTMKQRVKRIYPKNNFLSRHR
jgi:hypothetical protein